VEIIIFIFLPAVVSWFLLALAPPGPGFIVALAIWAVGMGFWGLMGWNMQRAPSGPDDWYRGIGLAGFFLALPAAAGPIAAQIWRVLRLRAGAPTYYPLALIAASLTSLVLFMTFFWDRF